MIDAGIGRARLVAAGALLSAIGAGLLARSVLSGLAAKVLGVMLWAAAAYALLLVLKPSMRVERAAAIALAVSFTVEVAQLSPWVAYAASRHTLFRLVFGATFSVWDLPMYAAGVALAAVVHRWLLRNGG